MCESMYCCFLPNTDHFPALHVVWPVLCTVQLFASDCQMEEVSSSVIFLRLFHFEVYMAGTNLAENVTLPYFYFVEIFRYSQQIWQST